MPRGPSCPAQPGASPSLRFKKLLVGTSARELQSAQSGPDPALSRGRPGHTAIAEEGLSPLRTALDLADPGRVGPWPIPTAHEGSSTNVGGLIHLHDWVLPRGLPEGGLHDSVHPNGCGLPPRLQIPACVAVPPRPAPILALDQFPHCTAVPPTPAPPLKRVISMQRSEIPGCSAIAGSSGRASKVLRYRGRPPRKVLRYLGARKRGPNKVLRYRGERGFPAIAGGGGAGTLRDKDAGCPAIAGVGRLSVSPVCASALAFAQSSRRRPWIRKSVVVVCCGRLLWVEAHPRAVALRHHEVPDGSLNF